MDTTRSEVAWDRVRRSFWLLPVLAMLAGGGLGFVVPLLDEATGGTAGLFTTSDLASARGLLQTIATVTVSVAGIAFSVTVVALQLASQQLGPRVLRTFQTDWLSQATLAAFLGLFVYALTALGRLSTITLAEGVQSPNLVLTIGVVAAILAFGLFAAFIQNTVVSLQASTLIRRIAAEGSKTLEHPYPSGIGEPGGRSPEVPEGAPVAVRAPRSGFLNAIAGEQLLGEAASCEGLIVQKAPIGHFVTEGMTIAEVRSAENAERLAERTAGLVAIGEERTLVQDTEFPVRQLVDVALRALSPGLNDPTTADNAMGSVAHVCAAFARLDPVVRERADEHGVTRLVALAPELDDLVRLGFEQVTVHSEGFPVLRRRLAELLAELRRVAAEHGCSTSEIDRRLQLVSD